MPTEEQPKKRLKPSEQFKQPARGGSPRNPDHSSGHKGISRVEHQTRNRYGWYTRVPWKGEVYTRFFSDSVHGGKEAALQEAIDFRNRIEKAIGKPRTDRNIMLGHQRSETGVVGVHRILKQGAPVYEVTWNPEPNRVSRTSVSIRKYGDDVAFGIACEIRREKEIEIFGAVLDDD